MNLSFSQFTPEIWDIALSVVRKTLKSQKIPKNLITMHLRRGDFKVRPFLSSSFF
jgi:hypothetical protein